MLEPPISVVSTTALQEYRVLTPPEPTCRRSAYFLHDDELLADPSVFSLSWAEQVEQQEQQEAASEIPISRTLSAWLLPDRSIA